MSQNQTHECQNILWRERNHCADEAYRDRLDILLDHFWGGWLTRWQSRPLALEVETALRHVAQTSAEYSGWLNLLATLDQRRRNLAPITQLIARLTTSRWDERFLARHALVAWGSEAIEPLGEFVSDPEHPLYQTALWLLLSIEHETTYRLAPFSHLLLCQFCLARLTQHTAPLTLGTSMTYYGCRICKQSQKFLRAEEAIAVLNNQWPEAQFQANDHLSINWLIERRLFDFDKVYIKQASNEEIERFVVQIGNDTDPFRRPRYKQMACQIELNCVVSENTRRILGRTFGRVEFMESERGK